MIDMIPFHYEIAIHLFTLSTLIHFQHYFQLFDYFDYFYHNSYLILMATDYSFPIHLLMTQISVMLRLIHLVLFSSYFFDLIKYFLLLTHRLIILHNHLILFIQIFFVTYVNIFSDVSLVCYKHQSNCS